jgi:hypothetical protein
VPLVVAAAWSVILVAGERMGRAPFAAPAPRNSAEAAAAGDAGLMFRFLHQGDNPHWIRTVRPDLKSSSVVQVTTAEAALWSLNVDIVRALDRVGAVGDRERRRQLACLARDVELVEIADYLMPTADCVPGEAIGRVRARSADAAGVQPGPKSVER